MRKNVSVSLSVFFNWPNAIIEYMLHVCNDVMLSVGVQTTLCYMKAHGRMYNNAEKTNGELIWKLPICVKKT